jgi:hypothetical protein
MRRGRKILDGRIRNTNREALGDRIPVANWAIEKLMTIAKLMRDFEFRAISVAPPDEHPGIIQDFAIPRQRVRRARATHRSLDRIGDYRELRGDPEFGRRYKVLGIAHGHGNLSPHHSGTDNSGFEVILNTSWTHNKTERYAYFSLGTPPAKELSDRPGVQAFTDVIVRNGEEERLLEAFLARMADEDNEDEPEELPLQRFKGMDLTLLHTSEGLSGPGLAEELDRLRASYTGRVLKSRRAEVSSIVVNHTGEEIYGIKRIRHNTFWITPEEIPEYEAWVKEVEKVVRRQTSSHIDETDTESPFFRRGGLIKYNLETSVEAVDLGITSPIDEKELVAELREKVKDVDGEELPIFTRSAPRRRDARSKKRRGKRTEPEQELEPAAGSTAGDYVLKAHAFKKAVEIYDAYRALSEAAIANTNYPGLISVNNNMRAVMRELGTRYGQEATNMNLYSMLESLLEHNLGRFQDKRHAFGTDLNERLQRESGLCQEYIQHGFPDGEALEEYYALALGLRDDLYSVGDAAKGITERRL